MGSIGNDVTTTEPVIAGDSNTTKGLLEARNPQKAMNVPKKKECYMASIRKRKVILAINIRYDMWYQQINDKDESSNGWIWYTIISWRADTPNQKNTTLPTVITDEKSYTHFLDTVTKRMSDSQVEILVEFKAHKEVCTLH